jgi:rRNA-processing protein FCF1
VNLVITRKVYSELEEMGKISDDDGSAAIEVLKFIPEIQVLETQPKPTGEEELVEVAFKHKCDFIVSDDIRAISKLRKADVPLIFSTHLLYHLYRAGIISKMDGLIALEKMRSKRTWKENLIYIAGVQLFR